MMEADPTVIESSTAQLILFALLAICVFAALICQFIAMRHKSENWIQFVHKDSMFRNKDLAYNETGMKFIKAQKLLAVLSLGICMALIFVSTP